MSFANTLYANILQRQQLERAQKQEQERYNQSRSDAQFQQMMAQGQQIEATKQAEFERHLKTAQMQSQIAAQMGKTGPDQYGSPAIQEQAQLGFDSAQISAQQAAAAARAKRESDMYKVDAPYRVEGYKKSHGHDVYQPNDSGGNSTMEERFPILALAKSLHTSANAMKSMFEDSGGPMTQRYSAAADYATRLYTEGVPDAQATEMVRRRFPDVLGEGGQPVPIENQRPGQRQPSSVRVTGSEDLVGRALQMMK